MSKFMYRMLPLAVLLLLGSAGHASAQSLSASFGVGTATDSSNGQSNDFFGTGQQTAPKLGGAFGTFGGQFMLTPHLGFGAEYAFRFSQQDYEGLGARTAFYDLNAVYEPLKVSSRIVPVFEGGIGGASVHIYVNQQFCAVSCQNQSQLLQTSNHFQAHLGAGVRFYVKGNIFVRPQFDLHIVPNFNEYGSDWVPQYTVAIGYTFGGR